MVAQLCFFSMILKAGLLIIEPLFAYMEVLRNSEFGKLKIYTLWLALNYINGVNQAL